MGLIEKATEGIKWIQDRLPTAGDADKDGEVQVMWPNNSSWLYVPFRSVVPGIPWRHSIPTLFVKLTYFKKTGKYYDDATFEIPAHIGLLAIWEMVEEMRADGKLPGLIEGCGKEFMILIDVPGHHQQHPRILV